VASTKVLIVGDLVVDEAWLVGKPAREERFAAHYNVLPRNIIDPRRKAMVAGGVGTVARTLSAYGVTCKVLTCWSSDLDPIELVPGDENPGHIDWVSVAASPYTARIIRVFVPEAKSRAKLVERYDRDTVEPLTYKALTWPPPDEVSLVVAGEYPPAHEGASVMDVTEVVREINGFHGIVPILLRSTREKVVNDVKWTVLSLNVHHLTRILGQPAFEGPLLQEIDGTTIYHPSLVDAIKQLAGKFLAPSATVHRYVLLNMEEYGALLVDREEVTPIFIAKGVENKAGIGATDVLLAHLADGLRIPAVAAQLMDPEPAASRDAVLASCERAIGFSLDFSAQSLTIDPKSRPDWRAAQVLVGPNPRAAVKRKQASPLDAEVQITQRSGDYAALLTDGIRLARANWYLAEYITVDKTFGNEVVRLTRQAREYLWRPAQRPFVAALCGDPGSGKSTLAKKIAKKLRCEVVEGNAAQWSSADDLFALCERVRSLHVRGKDCLVFIDEVDSLVAGEELYGKLLAPLWDGAYFLGGDERTLGLPTIFLLAGSTADWRDGTALLGRGGDRSLPVTDTAAPSSGGMRPSTAASKLPDLVSRLSAKPLTIPELSVRQADIVYLAAAHFLKQNPRVTAIEAGVLRLLAEKPSFLHGVRSITKIVDLFRPLSDDTKVTTRDIGDRHGELELQMKTILPGWESLTEPVAVSE
jgi:hypothetical protein